LKCVELDALKWILSIAIDLLKAGVPKDMKYRAGDDEGASLTGEDE
jgi:hypothetical protein